MSNRNRMEPPPRQNEAAETAKASAEPMQNEAAETAEASAEPRGPGEAAEASAEPRGPGETAEAGTPEGHPSHVGLTWRGGFTLIANDGSERIVAQPGETIRVTWAGAQALIADYGDAVEIETGGEG